MKTIYSLQEFRQELLKLAALRNEDYVQAQVKIESNGAVLFEGYINGLAKYYIAGTMEGVLGQIRDDMFPVQNIVQNIDVEIELPESME
jgi:hypothetical protein